MKQRLDNIRARKWCMFEMFDDVFNELDHRGEPYDEEDEYLSDIASYNDAEYVYEVTSGINKKESEKIVRQYYLYLDLERQIREIETILTQENITFEQVERIFAVPHDGITSDTKKYFRNLDVLRIQGLVNMASPDAARALMQLYSNLSYKDARDIQTKWMRSKGYNV